MTPPITLSVKNQVANLSLNCPERCNALNPELITEFLLHLRRLKQQKNIKALVIRGEGRIFCSGADLCWLRDKKTFNKKEIDNLMSLLEEIYWFPFLVLCRVRGGVFGGGLGLISVADIVLAENNTQFCFSEKQLGLLPSIISPFVLERISKNRALFYMTSAKVFFEKEALDIGLVHFVGSKISCTKFIDKILEEPEKESNIHYRIKSLLNTVQPKLLQKEKFSTIRSYLIETLFSASKDFNAQNSIHQFLSSRGGGSK